jgi:hypothetical protein
MSAFLVEIQAYVDLNFTNALGYNATFRTAFSTFLDNFMVPVVDVENPADEYTIAIANSFAVNSPTNYNNATGTTRLQFYKAAEYAVNLVVQNSVNPASSSKICCGKVTQTGVDNPIVTIVRNTVGALVATRVNPGEYNFTFPAASFPDIAKCQGMWVPCLAPVGDLAGIARFVVVNATIMKVLTYVATSDIGTGVITYAPSDAILNDTDFYLTVFP